MVTENYNYFHPEWYWINIDFECECGKFRFRNYSKNENLKCPECGRKYKIVVDILKITEEK